jgi:ATP-dependent RNA helicase RhlE
MKTKTSETNPIINTPQEKETPNETLPAETESATEPATEEASAAAAAPADWSSLGLGHDLLNLIEKAGFKSPTPVQVGSIPRALNGEDLICSAQTGTGKTAAFGFPLIERVKGRNGTYALVLAPSREIALQTQKFFNDFGAPLGIVAISLIGGTDLKTDEAELRKYPQIIVATPGRMCDHLERGNVWLEYMEVLVLDEADRMLEMGFATQLNRILDAMSTSRQTLLFSATLNPVVEKLAHKILYEPFRIQIGQASKAAKTVEQDFIFLDEEEKLRELRYLLDEEPGTVFVFVKSKDRAASLWRSLRNKGFHQATQLHSDLKQNVREEALQDFKDGKYRVLIATDVVGRGIHVDAVAHVINFDMPREADDYVHRIGRTGRAESTGRATSLVTPRDYPVLRTIEKIIGRKINYPQRQSNQPPQHAKPQGKPQGKPQQSQQRPAPKPQGQRPQQQASAGPIKAFDSTRNEGVEKPFGNSKPAAPIIQPKKPDPQQQ